MLQSVFVIIYVFVFVFAVVFLSVFGDVGRHQERLSWVDKSWTCWQLIVRWLATVIIFSARCFSLAAIMMSPFIRIQRKHHKQSDYQKWFRKDFTLFQTHPRIEKAWFAYIYELIHLICPIWKFSSCKCFMTRSFLEKCFCSSFVCSLLAAPSVTGAAAN